MAITPTGDLFKALKFDNTSSRSYGVYITGEAVYNAPERAVEMVSIPGRNGAFALDLGRFENITVSYPAGIAADSEAEFAEAISEFRNFLCSKRGYCRLEDEYNPGEYRLAIYKSGLEVDPAMLQAGEFDIVFECKPQRWLTSGEAKQTIAASGDDITNPTLFESGPLLEVEGYGSISFNGRTITIEDDLVGDVVLVSTMNKHTNDVSVSYADIYTVTNDQIDVTGAKFSKSYRWDTTAAHKSISNATILSYTGTSTAPTISFTTGSIIIDAYFDSPITFSVGTDLTKTVEVNVKFDYSNGTNETITFSFDIRNEGEAIRFITYAGNTSYFKNADVHIHADAIVVHSTATTFGHPTYIDCDLGEAYAIDGGGGISSLNSYIDLGSILPTLAVGSTEITFDNTITSLKITPRWWKV